LREKKEKKRMETTNAFDLASSIGYECYGEIGKKAFEELELTYVSSIAPAFENSRFRSFQNLNLYWARSYLKNTMLEDFLEDCLPDDYLRTKIVGGTTETLFGSINNEGTRLIRPMFWGYDLAYIPELFSYLTSRDMQDKVNTFNEVLEGNLVTRRLLKFGNATQELIESFKDEVGGLFFDGETLSYTPRTAFVVCTRPVDGRIFAYLEGSGFWSRFHTIQIPITDHVVRSYFTGSFDVNLPDVAEMKKTLLKMNTEMHKRRASFSNKEPDYERVQLPLLQRAFEYAEQKGYKMEAELNDVANFRIRGDIIREVRSYMLIRPELQEVEAAAWAAGRIPHFFDFVIEPEIAQEVKVQKPKVVYNCQLEIVSLIKGKKMARNEIVEELQKMGYKRTTVDRALKSINDKGYNKCKEYGFYEG
jgi:hypothetical protein